MIFCSADWDDLALPIYQDALLMSSPSRSDTNHLMVESLLQQKGWVKGWETLLTSAGNLADNLLPQFWRGR